MLSEQLKISSGNTAVIENGSLVVHASVPFDFIFDEADPPLQFRFIVKPVCTKEDCAKTELRKLAGGILQITFSDFPAGTIDNASPEPLCLGFIDDKKLLFSYRIDAHGAEEPYIFHYAWYLEEDQS